MHTFKTLSKIGFAITATLFIHYAPVLTANAETVTIPAGTRVPVMVSNNISSNTVKTAETINLTIAEDVFVESKQVFRRGYVASINVEKAQANGHWGRPGYLELNSGQAKDIQGNPVPINMSYTAKGASRRAFSIAGTILSVPLVLFLVGLVTMPVTIMTSGKEAQIGQGLVLDTMTTSPTEVEL